jgi:DNA-binding CsgD family transcriptional regulator
MPITEKDILKDERNQQICLRFAAGDRLEEIADGYDISIQRVLNLFTVGTRTLPDI